MWSASLRASRTALLPCLLLLGVSTGAQAEQAWVDPPAPEADVVTAEPAASPEAALRTDQEARGSDQVALRPQDAQALAVNYLNLWSGPNRLALMAASSFYGPTVTFHRRERTLDSVLAEKRRFTERWPQRSYRYRPETTMVACESSGAHCTVWAIFDFSAASPEQDRRSQGIAEHEIVVSLSAGRPVIVAETSRVLQRGPTKTH